MSDLHVAFFDLDSFDDETWAPVFEEVLYPFLRALGGHETPEGNLEALTDDVPTLAAGLCLLLSAALSTAPPDVRAEFPPHIAVVADAIEGTLPEWQEVLSP